MINEETDLVFGHASESPILDSSSSLDLHLSSENAKSVRGLVICSLVRSFACLAIRCARTRVPLGLSVLGNCASSLVVLVSRVLWLARTASTSLVSNRCVLEPAWTRTSDVPHCSMTVHFVVLSSGVLWLARTASTSLV